MTKAERKEVELTINEQVIVYNLAEGNLTKREDASAIFDKYIRDHVRGGRVSPELNFLCEVFAKVPCTVMKNQYRQAILTKIPPAVHYDPEGGHFYYHDGSAMSTHFWRRWIDRRKEFPQIKFV